MICFDDIDNWVGLLAEVLLPLAPGDIQNRLQAANPKYIEDARDQFLRAVGFDSVVDSMLAWMRSNNIAGYHGTRLTAAEVESVKANGLIPLMAASRSERLKRALSQHPRWHEVADRLRKTIESVGPKGGVGSREGQVHLTLSRSGLTKGFNHYLTHGAEFDWHVASELLGEEGKELLSRDGVPYVIQVAVPGEAALAAAHPFFTIEMLRAKGALPNIVGEFLGAWCFRLAHPSYQSRNLWLDCGMMFKSTVPAEWIRRIDPWPCQILRE
jgi:hypothetical protein